MWIKLHDVSGEHEVLVNFDRVMFVEPDTEVCKSLICFNTTDCIEVIETLDQIEMAINAGLEMEHGGL